MPNEPVCPILYRELKAAHDRGLRPGWLRAQAGYDAATFSRMRAGAKPPADPARMLRLLAAMGTSADVSADVMAELAKGAA